jgi:hypothetical protein
LVGGPYLKCCREISTNFEGNTTISAVITLWQLLTKYQTIIFITNSSDKLPGYPLTLSVCKVGADNYIIMVCRPYANSSTVASFHGKREGEGERTG